MYIDDYGREYETLEDAEKFFEKEFDEKMNDVREFSEVLWYFTDTNLTKVLEILCEKDKTILDTLKKHFSKEFRYAKKDYVQGKIDFDIEESEEDYD